MLPPGRVETDEPGQDGHLIGEPLVDAVAAYERVMLPRGLAAVDSSLRMAAQLFGNDGNYS